MTIKAPTITDIENELKFTTSRSGGPGGQSVNKVNTKVTLRWDIENTESINAEQRKVILAKLGKIINNEGTIVISAQSTRSQLQNKEAALGKLELMLKKAFKVIKTRKPTKPTKASVTKRLDNKKRQADKKKRRKGID